VIAVRRKNKKMSTILGKKRTLVQNFYKMILKEIKYTRFGGESFEWSIQGKQLNEAPYPSVTFDQINLIVGKNATGKSNTIMSIMQLAVLLSDKIDLSKLVFHSSKYEVCFQNSNGDIDYLLEFKDGKVIKEQLDIGGNNKINRAGSKGTIFYEGLNENLAFETDDKALAVTRRDKVQHPYLENLYQWGKQLFFYKFGSTKGKGTFVRDLNQINEEDFELKDSDDFVGMFKSGKDKIGDTFVNNIKNDMKAIGYAISEIGIEKPKFYPFPGFALTVKEDELDDITDQTEMSQGMFRALSLLVQINYSLSFNIPSCILIDDIGEGLDYERSKSLIELIIDKSRYSNIQVFMTTNDRFVMNKIPLEYWSVIERVKQKSIFYNYRNSKDIFDSFAFTGLNNFDFFATDFYLNGLEEQVN
jgi:AAA15 family ATPase/GTPase